MTLIQGIRSGNPALTDTRLIRIDDGTYLDIWRWESADQMRAAAAAARDFPLVGQTFALVSGHAVTDGEVVDER